MDNAIKIGNWMVSTDREQFRIFPKNKQGQTVPVTRINIFLTLTCIRSGAVVVFKRYWHMKQWFWRDSRDSKPCDEMHVLEEVARMLYGKDKNQAGNLLVAVLQSLPLA